MIRAWLTRLLLGGVLTASLLAVALLAGLAPAAEAAPPPATIAVTSCPANQAALQNLLNQAGSESPAVIQFTSTASNCQLNLSSTLTIGAGVDITIDGNGLTLIGDRTSSTPGTFNMILINDSPDNISKLALSDMTVKDGGSGIGDLSGVASVTVTDSTITGNDAANGILVGQVTVTNSTVSDNGGSGAGAGIGAVFGATVINSTVSDNGGDGVATGEGATAKATVMNSTIEHNNGNGVNSPTVDVSNSTVNDNQKTGIVGDTTTVTSSTVSGNVVNGIAGVNSATVSNSTVVDSGRFGVGGTGTITVESSTISGSNVAGVYGENGATLTATILTANATDCAVTGALTDGGYNLLASPDGSDNSCVFTGGTHGSLAVTDAQLHLLPLGNYGGPTQTIALDSGSKAIDFVPLNNGGHCSVGAQQTDQRGVPRPQGSGCDAGAFERTTTLVSLTCQQSPAQAAYTQGGQSWYAENVTESCPLIDDAASIYDTVSLTTKVAAGQASAAAPLGLASPACSGESCGQLTLSDTQACLTSDASDCVALPSTTFAVDRQAPAITSPVAGKTYTLGQTVPLTCDDGAGSGLATCQATITFPDGSVHALTHSGDTVTLSQLGTYTFQATSTDNVSNQAQLAGSFTVGYQLVPMPGNTSTVNHGYFAMIRFAPEDAQGHDYASRNLKVTSVELDGPNGQVIPFAYQFQFTMAHDTPQYQLEINTRNLTTGTWTLKIQIGTGANATTGSVTFTVK